MCAVRICRRWRVKPGQRKWFTETRYSLSIYPVPNNVKAAVEVSLNVKCCYFSSGGGLWQMPRTFRPLSTHTGAAVYSGQIPCASCTLTDKENHIDAEREKWRASPSDLALNISAGLNKSENPIHQAWNEQLWSFQSYLSKIWCFLVLRFHRYFVSQWIVR